MGLGGVGVGLVEGLVVRAEEGGGLEVEGGEDAVPVGQEVPGRGVERHAQVHQRRKLLLQHRRLPPPRAGGRGDPGEGGR